MTDTRLARQDREDFDAVIRTPQGMRFAAYLIDICGAYQQSYCGDAAQGAFLEGRRSIGLMLLSRMHEKGTAEAEYFRAAAERNDLRRKDAEDAEKKKGGWPNGHGQRAFDEWVRGDAAGRGDE